MFTTGPQNCAIRFHELTPEDKTAQQERIQKQTSNLQSKQSYNRLDALFTTPDSTAPLQIKSTEETNFVYKASGWLSRLGIGLKALIAGKPQKDFIDAQKTAVVTQLKKDFKNLFPKELRNNPEVMASFEKNFDDFFNRKEIQVISNETVKKFAANSLGSLNPFHTLREAGTNKNLATSFQMKKFQDAFVEKLTPLPQAIPFLEPDPTWQDHLLSQGKKLFSAITGSSKKPVEATVISNTDKSKNQNTTLPIATPIKERTSNPLVSGLKGMANLTGLRTPQENTLPK